jgi:hypothetical protein
MLTPLAKVGEKGTAEPDDAEEDEGIKSSADDEEDEET